MNVKIKGKGKNKLRLELEGGDYSVVNLLKENVWEQSAGDINKASYRKGHPYLGEFELLVESEENDPVEVLLDAAEKMKQDTEEFAEKLNEAV